jgi:calcium-dependent protein kinase
MRELQHNNVIAMHEVYEDRENIFIVMDCCSGGELFDRIKTKGTYSEADAAVSTIFFVVQVVLLTHSFALSAVLPLG